MKSEERLPRNYNVCDEENQNKKKTVQVAIHIFVSCTFTKAIQLFYRNFPKRGRANK